MTIKIIKRDFGFYSLESFADDECLGYLTLTMNDIIKMYEQFGKIVAEYEEEQFKKECKNL